MDSHPDWGERFRKIRNSQTLFRIFKIFKGPFRAHLRRFYDSSRLAQDSLGLFWTWLRLFNKTLPGLIKTLQHLITAFENLWELFKTFQNLSLGPIAPIENSPGGRRIGSNFNFAEILSWHAKKISVACLKFCLLPKFWLHKKKQILYLKF